MIYCVWYPSGGFGHFVRAVLTIYGDNFLRPTEINFKFEDNGNSHSLLSEVPVYRDQNTFNFNFDNNINYVVLVDNGIDNESVDFFNKFPVSTKIKLCYSELFWPGVAKTLIIKAMQENLDQVLIVDKDKWPDTGDWATREKYFLFLRDHPFRFKWKLQSDCVCLTIEDLRDYTIFKNKLESANIHLQDFYNLWQSWYEANDVYYKPVEQALSIIDSIENQTDYNLSNITDIWEQAVIYYVLWLKYGKEVPHYDYADFFKSSTEIRQWLDQ